MVARVHFGFRNSQEGGSTWTSQGGIDASELNDGTNDVFIRILGASGPAYPTALDAHGITDYGYTGSIPSSTTDLTLTNAGGSGHARRSDLAGQVNWTTGGHVFQVDVQNGTWEIEYAAGGATDGTADSFVIYDGTGADISAGTGSYNAVSSFTGTKTWANSTAFGTSDFVIDTFGQVWDCTTAGTTAASGNPPNNAVRNDTFNSNGCILTYTGRKALAWGFTTVGATNVASHNSDGAGEVAVGSWPGTPKTVTVTNGAITVTRAVSTARPRVLNLKLIPVPLEDVDVYDHFDQLDATPDVWAQQVAGYRAARLSFQTGSTANISISGTMASYFDLVQDGGNWYLDHNGTPIPDALAGSRAINIVQTDALSSGSPYTTVVNMNVISSGGRTNTDDGTAEGAICTQSWMNLDYIRSVHATHLWEGYNGSSPFTTDVTVTTLAGLVSAIDAAEAASTGSSWHRIRLQEGGTFDGSSAITADFGATGGLLIEPDTGHDPDYTGILYPFNVCGVHWRNTLMTTAADALSTQRKFRADSAFGPTGIAGNGRSVRVAFTGNRIGVGFRLTMDNGDDKQIVGYDINDDGDYVDVGEVIPRAVPFFTCTHAESVYVDNNIFDGGTSASHISVNGARAVKVTNNLFMRQGADVLSVNGLDSPTNTMGGFFADDSPHAILADNVLVREPAYAEFSSNAHADFWQGRTPGQNASFWYPSSGEENDTGNPWEVNDICFKRENSTWYKVVSITTGLTGATGPTGTGTGIVDGGVTWDFYADNSLIGVPWYVAVYGNDVISCNGVTAGGFDRQFYIDSQDGFEVTTHASVFDNTNSLSGDKGINFQEGYLYAEHNTFGAAAEIEATDTFNPTTIKVNTGDGNYDAFAVIRKNVVMGSPSVGSSVSRYIGDNIVLEWDVSASASANAPAEYLVGPFGIATYATSDQMYVTDTVNNSGEASKEGVTRQIRTAYRNYVNDAGIWTTFIASPVKAKRRPLFGPGYML